MDLLDLLVQGLYHLIRLSDDFPLLKTDFPLLVFVAKLIHLGGALEEHQLLILALSGILGPVLGWDQLDQELRLLYDVFDHPIDDLLSVLDLQVRLSFLLLVVFFLNLLNENFFFFSFLSAFSLFGSPSQGRLWSVGYLFFFLRLLLNLGRLRLVLLFLGQIVDFLIKSNNITFWLRGGGNKTFLFSTSHYLILEALCHFLIRLIKSLLVGFFWVKISSTLKVSSKNSRAIPACFTITANPDLTNLLALSPPRLAHRTSLAN